MRRYLFVGIFFIFLLFALSILIVTKGVIWQSNNKSSIKLISPFYLGRFYRIVDHSKFKPVIINHVERLNFINRDTPGEKEVVSYNRNRQLVWQCSWEDTFLKVLFLKVPVKKINIFFNIDETILENKDDFEFIVNRNFNSCLVNVVYKSSSLESSQILKMDMDYYEKMKSINKGRLFRIN